MAISQRRRTLDALRMATGFALAVEHADLAAMDSIAGRVSAGNLVWGLTALCRLLAHRMGDGGEVLARVAMRLAEED